MLEHQKFRATLVRVDWPFELNAMASQIAKVAMNLRKKHLAVDLGFALSGATLRLFGAA